MFCTFFGVFAFSVSANFDLYGLMPFLEKKTLKRRLSLENKHSLKFNVIPFEFNCNKILSKNR